MRKMYKHLKDEGLLESCLGFSDALAIQKMGAKVFLRFFSGKRPYFWRSVVRRIDGSCHVPCLFVKREGNTFLDSREVVRLEWDSVEGILSDCCPSVRIIARPLTP